MPSAASSANLLRYDQQTQRSTKRRTSQRAIGYAANALLLPLLLVVLPSYEAMQAAKGSGKQSAVASDNEWASGG